MYLDLFHFLVKICIPNLLTCLLLEGKKKNQIYIKENSSHHLESISKGQGLGWTLCVHKLQPLAIHLKGRRLQAGKLRLTELMRLSQSHTVNQWES